ncbi:NADH dehydrogenase [ubiquinone] 1 alpha subcomplex assembly factor 8-like [Cotesia glomerata]|uniref:NADH dehydrogenase [ubiquinone] 1 alpha subcomplex assembly factor 8-like n=1 Tax=Cotesia glomerata TaxID=32391 RepID=UPI001D006933|nr:NADH dehydrogenase [ubiquinone] 1 alpha subcomplex assembly factor 8-like [Cotesia glomerata]
MNSVTKARERLKKYPLLFAQCKESAIDYGKCVVSKQNIGKDDCQKEFNKFKSCLVEAARKNKTKL